MSEQAKKLYVMQEREYFFAQNAYHCFGER